jgi:hypothetical protein
MNILAGLGLLGQRATGWQGARLQGQRMGRDDAQARMLEEKELERQAALQAMRQDEAARQAEEHEYQKSRRPLLQQMDQAAVAKATAPPQPGPVSRSWQKIVNKRTGKVSYYDPNSREMQQDVADEGVEPTPPPKSGPSDELKFGEIARLRGEFTKYDAPYRMATTSRKQMEALMKDGTGASDVALLYAAVKAVDPESVVREGEVALQRLASNWIDRFGLNAQKFLGGREILTPAMRQELLQAADSRMGPLQQNYQMRRQQYEQYAKRWNVDPFEVVGPGDDDQPPGAPPPQSGNVMQDLFGGTPSAPAGNAAPDAFAQERQRAQAAIKAGKDPNAVAKRFKEKTGQDL